MRAFVAAAILATLPACGRISFDGRASDAAVDDSPTDVVAIDALLVAPPCGTSVLLTDELDDTTAMPLFVGNTDPGVALTEGSGHLDVNFIAGGAQAGAAAFYTSVGSFAITGLCAVIDYSVVPTNGGDIFFELLTMNADREAYFDANPTQLFAATKVARAFDDGITLPRDPSMHYWRLRNQGGTMFWDVSADDVTFYEVWSLPSFFAPTDTVQVLFGAGAGTGGTTAVDIGRFERVRATGP